MGGAEVVVPLGILILFLLLFPAYLKNRQRRLAEVMRNVYRDNLIRVWEVSLIGRWFRYPGIIGLTSDNIIIRNSLSLYNEEIPFERIRTLIRHEISGGGIPHPEDASVFGNVITIRTTELVYSVEFHQDEEAGDFKTEIERTI
jgi:hypothetical protein